MTFKINIFFESLEMSSFYLNNNCQKEHFKLKFLLELEKWEKKCLTWLEKYTFLLKFSFF